MVFTGNANPELARKVASRLYLSLGKADVGRFSDGEIAVELNENVRGKDVFVLQPTCAPTNDNLMELLVVHIIKIVKHVKFVKKIYIYLITNVTQFQLIT